ncbi:PEGA domain-containing protein, partial [bacterium]|nr:PEGA domain-containing protein [bacterium]
TPTVDPHATPTATPMIPPDTEVIVTDDQNHTANLCGQEDYDYAEDRRLCIRWSFRNAHVSSGQIKDVHVYVKSDTHSHPRYLGSTGTSSENYLTWEPNGFGIAQPMQDGPQFDENYTFIVYMISRSGVPGYYGPFLTQEPVAFLEGLDPTPTPTFTPRPTDTPTATLTPTHTPTSTPTEIPVVLDGYVRSMFGGEPIPNAEIAAGEYETLTNHEGAYYLVLPSKGRYTLRLTADGYKDFSFEKNFRRSQTLNFRLFPLPRTPTPTPTNTPTPSPTPINYVSVYGYVYDDTAWQMIRGATIQVGERETESKLLGFFILDEVEEGEYTIKVSKEGYEDFQETTYLDENYEMVVPLTPEN